MMFKKTRFYRGITSREIDALISEQNKKKTAMASNLNDSSVMSSEQHNTSKVNEMSLLSNQKSQHVLAEKQAFWEIKDDAVRNAMAITAAGKGKLMEYIHLSRAEFEQMTATARSRYIAAGGRFSDVAINGAVEY